MSRSWRRMAVLIGAVALTVSGAGVATAGPGPGAGPTTGPDTSTSTDSGAQPGGPSAAPDAPAKPSGPSKPRTVHYRGVQVTAPAGWSVVDLDTDPTRCVRLDVDAVYVGTPGSQQNCPAHKVGRAQTVWLHPASDRDTTPMTSRTSKVGALQAHTGRSTQERAKSARFTGKDVQVDAAWGDSEAKVDEVLATAKAAPATAGPPSGAGTSSGSSTSSSPSTSSSSTTSSGASTQSSPSAYAGTAVVSPATFTSAAGTPTTAAAVPAALTATAASPRTFTGMGFDTCAAPSAATMQKWLGSPYRAVGVYIGGSMRACGDGNLSASWVNQVSSMGWGLIPIYVGVQAPCVNQTGLATIDPKQAAAQGKAAANDAVTQAARFGLGSGTPIYYDMEGYNNRASGCTGTVMAFMTAWTQQLHAKGYNSGAYGSTSSLMVDMSRAIGTSGFTPPDNVWFASWNGQQTLSDSTVYPDFKDSYWSAGQRLHQYSTGTETWGGASLNIDANWLGGRVTGNPVSVGYGAGTFGPGSTSFLFTGSMYYWKANEGYGYQKRAYYTYTSYSKDGSLEENGATWSPSLSTGLYAVDAYVPETNATARVTYAVTDANGTVKKQLDQSTLSGWSALGTYLARNGTSVGVHAGDSSTISTTKQVGIDAMRFRLVATAPSAPTSVSAVPDNGRATVRWTAATNNGSPVTSYTVTASPGGARTTVSGSATSATITGLANDSAYTFTVQATNVVGTGPVSQASAPVTPKAFSHLVPVAPTRLLDTRSGTASNPVRSAVPAWGSVTIKVAGVGGSPVPAGATAAAVNLTVTAPQKVGFLSVDSTSSTGTSTANFTPGQTVANLLVSRLSSSGTVTVVNHSSGSVHLVADVTGYLTTSGTASRWATVAPTRLLDTRSGTATNPVRTAVPAWGSVTIKVAGVSGSPVPAGATAAAINLTATAPQRVGFLSVDSTSSTGTSTANYTAGQTIANLLVSRLSSSGTVTVVNHSGGTVHLVADVTGYLTAGGSANQWASVAPARLLDTRSGTATNPVRTAVPAGGSVTIKVAGVNGSPVPAGATAAAINLTATAPQNVGFLSVDSTSSTGTSTANYTAGQTVANLLVSRLSSSGTVTVVNHSSGTVHLVADVTGYLR
ncbi:glycoside hydrolase domain-containing protein [Terrabacter sp. NPDC080008]|uniref:glycoside hydrolase domain-containing protein n=1 Tax=Terrabacter sp. NPDC080008 TaxID=3155176 RepID=UPI00344C9245